MGILRLSHVDITVTDLDLACAYYTKVIGMVEVARSADSAYLRCWDETDHHSLRLTYAPRVGFDLMSFKVTSDDDLAQFERAVGRYGFPVQRVSRGQSVGQGESIRFDTPSGHAMELVRDVDKVGSRRPTLGLPAWSVAWTGPFDPGADPQWRQVASGALSERQYWAIRAAEFGALTGRPGTTRELIRAMYTDAENVLARREARALMSDARAAGLPVGILTNDLGAFHSQSWIDELETRPEDLPADDGQARRRARRRRVPRRPAAQPGGALPPSG